MALSIGDKLGPYEILAPIGEGGMGEVWKARDTRLDRIVAIKTSKSAFTERFEREARAVASLNHPNICQLYDVGPNYLVMEFIEGPQLQGPMPVDKAVETAGQILDALDAAHRKRITHRDLKPANIIVTRQGIKLLDFGLAKLEAPLQATDATLVAAPTSKGEIVGTLQYMAPEQLQSKPVDARSDLFSFGCVLYELLTGRQAFSGESTASVIASILEREPAPTNLPAPLDRILKTCLEKDPDKRFQNALDLKRSLHWAMERLHEFTRPPSAARRGIPLWACIVPTVLALGLAAYLAIQWRKPSSELAARPILRVTRDGSSSAPVLSLDGKLLAFVSLRDGNPEIYVQQSNGTTPIRLTNDPARDTYPNFSADGTRIFFYSSRNPEGVYEVPALGGDATLVAVGAFYAKPSPDGKYLALTARNNDLHLKALQGGELQTLSGAKGRPVTWSPDSTRLIVQERGGYVIWSMDGSSRPLDLEGNLRRRMMYNGQWSALLRWMPGDQLLLASPFGDANNLWRIPLDRAASGEFIPVTLGTSHNYVEADAAAGRIAFSVNNTINTMWSLPCDLDSGKVLGREMRILTGPADGNHPAISPDGRWLAYASRKNGPQGLWLRDLQTGKERLIVQPRRGRDAFAHVVFSPDGKMLAAQRAENPGDGRPNLLTTVLLHPTRGELTELLQPGGRLRGWTPDGKLILMWNIFKGFTVDVLDVNSRKLTTILKNGDEQFSQPKLSHDGKWLAFTSSTRKLLVAPFHGAAGIPASEWITIAENAELPFWSPDGNTLYFSPAKTFRRFTANL